MSDQAQPQPIVGNIANVEQLKQQLDIGRQVIDNWEMLDKIGAVKNISKAKMQRIQGLLEQLFTELTTTEELPPKQ